MSCPTYLAQHARKLDLHLYEYLFESADVQPVLDDLATYQNKDGGFGHALEPDMRLPDSSTLATTVAFQYLVQLPADSASPLVLGAVQFLLETYDPAKNGWVNIPPRADHFPRAPWWNYTGALQGTDWGNPSAEVLGYLLRYANKIEHGELLHNLTDRAVQRLLEIQEPEQHEIKCFIRLYENAGEDLQAKLHSSLAEHIKQAANTNQAEWQGYVATPLTFITSPDSPFADLFSHDLLMQNIEHLRAQEIDGDHWEPNWEWSQFEAEWTRARKEWSGKLTVDNLQILRAFGAL